MIKLALLCESCGKQMYYDIPEHIIADFREDHTRMTITIKKWLKENGIICKKCNTEYTILWNENY